MPLIPNIKFTPSGNKSAAQGFKKFAFTQLGILKRQMSYQNLNEGRRVVSPFLGVHVECLSKFGHDEVRVFVSTFDQPLYQDRVSVEAKRLKLEDIIEEIKGLNFFVRIKHSDMDVLPYSPPSSSNYDQITYSGFDLPDMDRLIVWEFDHDESLSRAADSVSNINRSNSFVPGKSTLVCDVDIATDTIYYPILTPEGNTKLLDAVRNTLLVTPSRSDAVPLGCLEDLALILFVTGGMSPPSKNANKCSTPYIPNTINTDGNSVYSLGDTFSMESTSDLVGCFVPPLLHDSKLSQLITEWCPSGSGSLTYYNDTFNFHGLDVAVNIGLFRVPPDDILYIQKDAHECVANYGYVHNVGNLDGGVTPELTKGVLYTGASLKAQEEPDNNFNCFFMSEYLFKSYGDYSLKEIGQGYNYSVEGDFYYLVNPDAQHKETVYDNILSGIMTPLEILPLSDISHHESGVVACAEYACAYEIPGDFGVMVFSIDGYEIYEENSHCGETPFNMDDMTRCYSGPNNLAWRETVGYNQTGRSDFHIATDNDVYFISLSYLHEARGAQKAMSKYIDPATAVLYGPANCNGIFAYEEEGPLTEIAYVCYVFSPKTLMKQNEFYPDQTDYWDINEAKRSSGIINPYRCLDIEEYVNVVLGEIQVELDAVPSIPLCGGTSAYPMRKYGYGITDGFLRK